MDNINIENYFDDDELVYIFKCTKCNYEDPVPDWLLDEFGAFSLFNKKVPIKTFRMTCPKCGKETMKYKNDNE